MSVWQFLLGSDTFSRSKASWVVQFALGSGHVFCLGIVGEKRKEILAALGVRKGSD